MAERSRIPDVVVRPYRSDDRESVVALWDQCGLTRPWNDPRRDIARKLAVQPQMFLVAELQTRIIGSVMAGYEGHRGWINYLAVAPEYRGKGIGKTLMDEAERRLLALGCPKINLQVRSGNSSAVEFYRAIGYLQDDVISFGKRMIRDEAK